MHGVAASIGGVTGASQATFDVTRSLAANLKIIANAARTIGLSGLGAAQTASTVSVSIASLTVSGTSTAAASLLGDAGGMLELSGKAAAQASPASEVSGAFEVGLTASGNAPRQAVFGAVLVVGGATAAVTDVASDAFGDLAPAGTAIAAVPLQAKASTAMAFTRDAAAAGLIDATSARVIAFGLNTLAHVDLAAGSVGQAPLHLASGAALATRAEMAVAVDLAGVASAQGGVKASGASVIKVVGTSASLAAVGADSLGAFTTTSAGETEAAVIGVSARSLPLIGDTAATAQLTADAVGGTLDLGLAFAAAGNIHAVASGAISLAGGGCSNIASKARMDRVFVVTRLGAGNLAVVGQSARVVTLLVQARAAMTTMAAANTSLPVHATASAEVRLLSSVQSAGFGTSEEFAVVIDTSGSVQQALWPIAGGSVAFLAPPSQRRGAFVSAQQGGGVLSKPQGGGVIPARITTAA